MQPGQDKPAAKPSPRRREAWLLTRDDALLIELGPMFGDRYRTHLGEDDSALSGAHLGAALLLLDASSVPDARAMAQRIGQAHPHLPILVVCPDGEVASWQGVPATPGQCSVLERGHLNGTAVARALGEAEQRLQAAGLAATANALPRLELPSTPPGRPWLAIVGGVVVVVAAAGWYFLRPGQGPAAPGTASAPAPAGSGAAPPAVAAGAPATATVATAPAPAPAPAQRTTLELLSDARVAFRDERLQLPRVDGAPQGDSALELYQRVLAQDPQNDEARDGMRRLLAVTRDRIQGDLAAGRLDDAARLLAAYRDSGLAGDDLARLGNEVNAARPRVMLQQARSALAAGDVATATSLATQLTTNQPDSAALAALKRDIAARGADQAVLQQAALVHAAIASGALLEPAGDNARTRLQALQQSARGNPATISLARELQLALLARAQQATRAGDFAQAQSLLATAGEYGASSELAGAQADLRTAQDLQSQRASAAEAQRLASSAPRVPQPVQDWRPAKPLKPLQADYPPEAQKRNLSGYAVVEFGIAADGRARDAHVVESSPPGVFDAAALKAVGAGRFVLATVDGPAANAQLGRLRIGFRPGEGQSGPGRFP